MSNFAARREALAAHLRSELGVDVVPVSVSRTITKPLIVVRIAGVVPGAVRGLRTVNLEVVVISAKAEPGPADDDLDALLDRTFDALDSAHQVVWTEATRAVWDESQPAYSITCSWED